MWFSYLGYGLMSARMNIFQLESRNETTNKSTFKKKKHKIMKINCIKKIDLNLAKKDSTVKTLKSVCIGNGLLPAKGLNWTQQNVEYSVVGVSNLASFDQCYAKVRSSLVANITRLPELNSKEIYAFSYFFDRLNSAKALSRKNRNIFIDSLIIYIPLKLFPFFFYKQKVVQGIKIRDIFNKAKSGLLFYSIFRVIYFNLDSSNSFIIYYYH